MLDVRSWRYMRRLLPLLAIACAGLGSVSAQAHPHVWVTMNSDLLYAPDGSITALRQRWTFDEMFSAFATLGVHAKTKGQFTRKELQPIAEVNVSSLKDFDYFTYAWIDDKQDRHAFTDPVDYWLTYDPKATQLTLHFTLPFKTPVKAKVLKIEIYDPTFFIDFGFADKNPVAMVDAPKQCALSTEKPYDASFQTHASSEANIGMGMDYANKILVQCP